MKDAFAKIIKKLERKSYVDDGWVPCSSGKLPEEGVTVWITYQFENEDAGVYRDRVINGEWEYYDQHVIAWKYMDIPKPYQAKGIRDN